MNIAILRKVSLLERPTTTTPIKEAIQEEIDAGRLIAKPVRSGPLGLYTGEMFIELTDKGKEALLNDKG